MRGRNAEWAEQTVRDAANLPATEALQQNVIDLIADNLSELIAALDGRTVTVEDGTVTLHLQGAEIETIEPGWRYELLALITEPNVAYMLLKSGLDDLEKIGG